MNGLTRYYDISVGRFCSADPVGGEVSDPQTWNRYEYGRNDPIDKTDPSGKFCELLIPLIEALLQSAPAAASVAIPTVTTTITVTAASTLVEVIGPTVTASIPLAAAGLQSGKTPLGPRDTQRFDRAQNKAQNEVDKVKCKEFLMQHGIDPVGLKSAIGNMQPWNAAKSSISEFDAGVFDPMEGNNQTMTALHEFQNTTIASAFRSQPGVMGMAQNGGRDAYFRPGGRFGSGGITAINVFHEALHNFLAKGDTRVAAQLGLASGAGRADINPALRYGGCF